MDFSELSDADALAELGRRLAQLRLGRPWTQAALAARAGVAKRTIERIEAGGSVQLTSLIRVFRSLDLLAALDALLPEPGPRPMELLKEPARLRRRARPQAPSSGPWTWGDEP